MIHPHTTLAWIDEARGHGVIATQDIPKGTLVWTLCDLDIVLKPAELEALAPASKKLATYFGYVDQHGDTIVCWDNGRYVNHSCAPAMMSVNDECEIAVRDIKAGEELTCDYGVLNYSSALSCACGASNCRGLVKAADAVDSALDEDAQVADALLAGKSVEQALLEYVKNKDALLSILNGEQQAWKRSEYFFRTSPAS